MTLADRLVILNEGKIQQIGTPQAIYAKPANRMVAAFLGSPPMNILPVTYVDNSFILHQQSLSIPATIKQQLQPHQGQNFDLGIRPEHISITSNSLTNNQTASITVEIDLIEPLGKEILIRANLPDSNLSFNLTAPGQWQGRKGDRLSIKLDLAQIYLFEPSSGQTLYQ